MLANVLGTLSAVSFLMSGACSLTAGWLYSRQPGASIVGFGFARYYYGDLRRTRPVIFLGSLGGVALGFALEVVAMGMRH